MNEANKDKQIHIVLYIRKIVIKSINMFFSILFKTLYALSVIGTILVSIVILYSYIFESEFLLIQNRVSADGLLISLMINAFLKMACKACELGTRNENNKVICLPDLRENKN
ncbi:hypothetical protein [Vibrio parahaemolyticus]|uniref:hypothetical protein n=1 Tax=Vibrio parahaemolyticus TaxID=670 RepID=UPI0035BF152A|nr:hypothetical protein [Vibrio parahaemolyticus]